MRIGQTVAMFSSIRGFRKFLTITEIEIPSGINEKLWCKTNIGALFYTEVEASTGRHYNVGNRAFWIIEASLSL